MNKSNAKTIAQVITFEQLQEMFTNAKNNITDWSKVSAVNKGMTKGTVWNLLYPALKPDIILHRSAIKNMIWEFGDHLPEELIPAREAKEKAEVKVTHQKPIF